MKVRVLFFGQLKDIVGKAADDLNLQAGATVADLLQSYAAKAPKLAALLPSLAVAVNQEFSAVTQALQEADEVALLPPVSGGKPTSEPLIQIVREKIESQSIVAPLRQPEDGAVLVFDGIVRNHTRERTTLYLEYEAYESMALAQMRELAAQAVERFPIRQVAMVHRLGRLEIGETSILIAVFSAHRAAAFDACRFLIDTLKKTVPIWKKEHFKDGAVWADGEPFPSEVPKAR